MEDNGEQELGLDNGPVEMVAVDVLLAGDTPRLIAENEDHTRALAESGQELPAILVHRETMRVIDGLHRLRAAQLRGAETIAVRYFDGSVEDAFVLAVRVNAKHGLPLSLAERKAAAERILRSHSQWSDRAIAAIAGLAATTVSALRDTSSAQVAQLNVRVGRDGRVRPLDGAAGRRRASEVLAKNPAATLREISAAAGISLNTARDVRNRVKQGEDPVPPKQRAGATVSKPRFDEVKPLVRPQRRDNTPRNQTMPPAAVLQILRSDPSLRFAEKGRILLRLLDSHAVVSQNWPQIVDTVPEHCAGVVANLADEWAQTWRTLADQLRDRRAQSA